MRKAKILVCILLVLASVFALIGCAKKHTVTFDTDGGSAVASQTVEKGEKVTKPENPTKEGYTFDGWYVGDDVWSFVGYVITENTTLKAKWIPTIYDITYNLDGGSISGNRSYTIEDEITLNNPTKTNDSGYVYEFLGWYDNANFDGDVITKIEKGSIGNKVLYAKWGDCLGLKFTKNGSSYKVSDADISITQITIPATYCGLPVTSIGYEAFDNCTSLTSVTIGYSVMSIGEYAFSDCSRLTDVYYMGEIEDWCNITFNSSSANPMYYANNLYINGKLLEEELIIPNTATNIGSYAFYNCTKLTSVEISSSVTSIGDSAFEYCSRLTSVEFGDNSQLTSIGDEAFYWCNNLTSITIPDSVTSIGDSAFYSCDSLTSVEFGDNSQLTSIGEWVFSDCTKLTSIEIPDSVTSIGNWAFRDCYSLTSIIIPNSVMSIGEKAFRACSSLTIYCEVASKPSGWDFWWNYGNRPVYWAGKWEYVDGVPTAKE